MRRVWTVRLNINTMISVIDEDTTIDRSMDGWINQWIDGWMDGWIGILHRISFVSLTIPNYHQTTWWTHAQLLLFSRTFPLLSLHLHRFANSATTAKHTQNQPHTLRRLEITSHCYPSTTSLLPLPPLLLLPVHSHMSTTPHLHIVTEQHKH